MRGDELRKLLTQCGPSCRDHVALGAAAIRYDSSRFQVRCDLLQHPRSLLNWNRYQNQIRADECLQRVVGDFIDDAKFHRPCEIGLRATNADDVGDDSSALERQGKGSTDEADAEDGKLAETSFAHKASQACSATCNARKKRSFSDSRPIDTRRCSGMP